MTTTATLAPPRAAFTPAAMPRRRNIHLSSALPERPYSPEPVVVFALSEDEARTLLAAGAACALSPRLLDYLTAKIERASR